MCKLTRGLVEIGIGQTVAVWSPETIEPIKGIHDQCSIRMERFLLVLTEHRHFLTNEVWLLFCSSLFYSWTSRLVIAIVILLLFILFYWTLGFEFISAYKLIAFHSSFVSDHLPTIYVFGHSPSVFWLESYFSWLQSVYPLHDHHSSLTVYMFSYIPPTTTISVLTKKPPSIYWTLPDLHQLGKFIRKIMYE